MHFYKIVVQGVFLLVLFSSCADDGGASVKEASLKICDCTKPLIEINQKLETMKRNGKIEELTLMMEKAGEAFEELVDCAEDHTTEKMDGEHLKNALVKNCKINVRIAEDVIKKIPLLSNDE